MRNITSAIKTVASLRPQAITTSTNGESVDRLGYLSAAAVLDIGAVSGTSPTLDVKIQESDDESTWTDVPGATFTQMTAADQREELGLELQTRKRYLRAVATPGGTSPNFQTSCIFILGRARVYPI